MINAPLEYLFRPIESAEIKDVDLKVNITPDVIAMPDDLKFCTNCGKPLVTNDDDQKNETASAPIIEQNTYNNLNVKGKLFDPTSSGSD